MMSILLSFSLLLSSCFLQAKISKLVIPCAGYGTRMLPFTKSVPKEMVTILDKPAMQLLAQEAVASGIKQCFIITKNNKEAIADHFDSSPELENQLSQKNKAHILDELNAIRSALEFVYIRQPYMGGTGHAVSLLKNFINDEYFCLGWPDRIILGEDDLFGTMIALAEKENAMVIAVTEIPIDEVQHHGVVVLGKELSPHVYEVIDHIEKPSPEASPSNMVNVGRFVLPSKIFSSLEIIEKAPNGELQIPDAISDLIHKGKRVIAYKMKGKAYDVGRPLAWLETVIHYGLHNPHFSDGVKSIIKGIEL